MNILIDPPSVDEDISEWQEFRDELEDLRNRTSDPEDIDQIEFWITRADAILSTRDKRPPDGREGKHGVQRWAKEQEG